MPLKIGVLLPLSTMFEGVDQAFIDGLRGAFTDADHQPKFFIEPIGAGVDREDVVTKAQRLLLTEAPQVITGVLGAGLMRHVQTVFRQHRTPFLVCNLGADVLPRGDDPNPFVFWNSMNVWQSVYALGWWAAEHVGRTAAVAAALHEAGYGIVHAWSLGFSHAGGGSIVATEVTHSESATEDPSAAIGRLMDRSPDLLFGLYSGREGISFMQAVTALDPDGAIPLVVTPLMTHGHWLPAMGPEVARVRTASSWVPGTHPEEESSFLEACSGADERPVPDVFGLLGYEAGLIIQSGLRRLGGVPDHGSALADALLDARFSSPRGAMTMDPVSRDILTTDQLVEIRPDASGAMALAGAGTLALPDRYGDDVAAARAIEVKSGWINPYLVN